MLRSPLSKPALAGLALCLLLASCKSSPNRERPIGTAPTWSPQASDPARFNGAGNEDAADRASEPGSPGTPTHSLHPGGEAVAEVAGTTITSGQLLLAWMYSDSEGVRTMLDKLVLDALVVAEARRLGVVLDPEIVVARAAQARAHLERNLLATGYQGTLETFIETQRGLSSERFVAALEQQATTEMLAELCVRGWSLETERARLRAIFVTDREGVDLVEAGLALGTSFEELARKHSADPASAANGGRIADVVRSNSTMSRIAFLTRVGEIGGPVEEGDGFLFVHVEERLPASGGPWERFGLEVHASLETRPIEDLEYVQWKSAMLDRYEISTDPLLRLVGEPLPGT